MSCLPPARRSTTGARDRETKRYIERQIGREKERERERDTERETEIKTDREIDREREIVREGKRDREIDGERERETISPEPNVRRVSSAHARASPLPALSPPAGQEGLFHVSVFTLLINLF